ncbi:MAG: hypothetical protein LH481_13375 [Burkholderiales bacterium]|nr:hypothetical protein [Burkholderiales bacterium]
MTMHSGFTLNKLSFFMVERPSLDQFVLLSLMLHVLAIVLFGDTTGGGARRGEKIWGALTVTVQGLLPDPNARLRREQDVAALQKPGGITQPAPIFPAPSAQVRAASPAAQVPVAEPAADSAPPVPSPSFEMPPVISKDVEKAVTEFVVPRPTLERPLTPPVPAPAPVIEPPPREAQTVPPAPLPGPIAAMPAFTPAVAPKLEPIPLLPVPRTLPVESKPREEPVVTPPTTPAPAPKVEREIAKPVIAPPVPKPPEVLPAAIQPIAPAPTVPIAPLAAAPLIRERENVQAVSPPVEVKPREIPVASAVAPPARVEAPKIEREVVAPPAAPPSAPASTVSPTPVSTRVPAGAPTGNPSAPTDAAKPRGDVIPPSVDASALAPAPALGKATTLDLDAVRRRAREMNSGSGPRTVFPFPTTPPQKPKTKEQQAFDKALKKNDCRDAYADMGLAAVVPLVISAVREDGCKW